MKLPYVLLAEGDPEQSETFTTVFGKQIAYATVSVVEDGKSLLTFLSGCGWKDLPDLIIINTNLKDMTAPDILREMLLDTRYLSIPKIIRMAEEDVKIIEECRMLGVKHFLRKVESVFDFETNVRSIDNLLKAHLNFH